MAALWFRSLPPELVDHMLDEIMTEYATISDRRALKNCSLVCKSWLPRSSVNLLRTIEVRTLQLEQYLAFAKTSPRLAAHVREFIICGTGDVTIHLDAIFATMPRLIYMELWNNLTTKFTLPPDMQLRDLEGNPARDHYNEPSPNCTAARGGSVSIDHLKLSRVQLEPTVISLRPFRCVETLELRSIGRDSRFLPSRVYMNYSPLEGLLPLTPSPAVKNIILDGSLNADVTTLLSLMPIRPLSITVKGLSSQDIPELLRLLKSAGGNLERLVLHPVETIMRPASGVDPDTPPSIVSGCPKLHMVEVIASESEIEYSWSSVLWHLHFKTLRQIRVQVQQHKFLDAVLSIRSTHERRSVLFNKIESVEFYGLNDGNPLSDELLVDLRGMVDRNLPDELRRKIKLCG